MTVLCLYTEEQKAFEVVILVSKSVEQDAPNLEVIVTIYIIHVHVIQRGR